MAGREKWFDPVGAEDKQAIEGDCSKLEFTHGIETEYFLTDSVGMTLRHAEFEKVYNDLVTINLIEILEEKIEKFYDRKISAIKIGRSKSSTYDAFQLTYKTDSGKVNTELVSVDRNVAEWPLMEIATPPCESLYEIAWWSSTLLSIMNERLKEVQSTNHLMPFGVNPFEYVEDITQHESFPTCGEHHHIKLVEDSNMSREEKAFFTMYYHLVRFYLPYLILLSACSPFASGGLWGSFRPIDHEMPFPRCVRSIRVLYNKKHLCNFQEGEYLPYLEKGWNGIDYFIQEFKNQSNTFRTDSHFLDMDPYSKNNHTTEIRVFDSQPGVARRVGIAVILQMLARRARKLAIDQEDDLYEAIKESSPNLQRLKKLACEGGNWVRPSNNLGKGSGNEVKLKKSKLEKTILSDAVLELMYNIRDEIGEANLIHSKFLYPIRASIYSMDGNGVSPSLYWLMTYIKENQDMERVINTILESTKKSEDIWYDDVVNNPIILEEILG